MKAAIVCAGPSAPQTWGAEIEKDVRKKTSYENIVAINAAANGEWLGRFHWWFAGDKKTFACFPNPPRLPLVGVCSMQEGLDEFRHDVPIRMLWSDAVEGFTAKIIGEPPNWTELVAIWWLHRQGARRIDVFGADYRGLTDCAGRSFTKHRTEDAWAKRRMQFETLSTHLAERGTNVKRILQ